MYIAGNIEGFPETNEPVSSSYELRGDAIFVQDGTLLESNAKLLATYTQKDRMTLENVRKKHQHEYRLVVMNLSFLYGETFEFIFHGCCGSSVWRKIAHTTGFA